MILDETLALQKGGFEVYFILYFIVVAQFYSDILFFEKERWRAN